MSRVNFAPRSSAQVYQSFLRSWAPSLTVWGAGIGSGALLFLSVTPLVRREVLSKVPLLGNYFEDQTPASDKPF